MENVSRRRFLKDAGGAAVAFSIVRPDLVRGTRANSKVDLGVIGCGGRGTWIANLFQKHGGYNIVAAADYFADRVGDFGGKLGVPEARRFTGLSAYQRLLEQRVDAVAIESPPFFHPIHAAAAVAAGKHVYLAKPVAVDVPGCRTIEESAAKATERRLCFLVDFQTRANEFFIEALRRVHAGALGQFAFGEATYHADDPFGEQASFDWDKFRSVTRVSIRALDNVLDATLWPLEEQAREAANKRRIGLGFTGLGNTLTMLNLRYDSEPARRMASDISRAMRDAAYEASVENAAEKGAFPLFDAEKFLAEPHCASRLTDKLKDEIRVHGIRNSHLLSIAPTGTISLAFAANASGGIEPTFSWTYVRKKRMPDGTETVDSFTSSLKFPREIASRARRISRA